MLDDLKYIHEKDASDALGFAAKQPCQLLHDFQLADWAPKKLFTNIVYAGMGGSALAAILSASWPAYKVPFEVCREYTIPAYVGEGTLFIASSYSGNTEETISALAEAEKRGAEIVIICGGGRLKEIAEQTDHHSIIIPDAKQPRYAVLYMYAALVQLLDGAGVFVEQNCKNQLQVTSEFLDGHAQTLLPEVPSAKNPAKQLAKELMGKSIVVYAGQFLSPAAYKWKISFNENAKNVAWMGRYPEFNHNEFIGWSSHPTHKPYAVIDLLSKFDHPRIAKRFELSARLLSGKRPEPHVVTAQGQTPLEQLLWTVLMGDFTSLYLGLLNGLNPAPVELVEKFKKALNDD